MNLSAADREKIYLEEKDKREADSGSPLLMMALTIGAMLAFAAIVTIAAKSGDKDVSIDDLRKAYPGLSPEEEGQEA